MMEQWHKAWKKSHRIHVWYIYLKLVDYDGKCRWIYHTRILWEMNLSNFPLVSMILLVDVCRLVMVESDGVLSPKWSDMSTGCIWFEFMLLKLWQSMWSKRILKFFISKSLAKNQTKPLKDYRTLEIIHRMASSGDSLGSVIFDRYSRVKANWHKVKLVQRPF